MMRLLRDLRKYKGRIWNVDRVVQKYPFGHKYAPWNKGKDVTEDLWIDDFIYEGFKKYGSEFLKALNGKFATVYLSESENTLFIARDWIGEVPLHFLLTNRGIFFANSINEIKKVVKDEYSFHYIKAFRHAHYQKINFEGVIDNQVSKTITLEPPTEFINFEKKVSDMIPDASIQSKGNFEIINSLFKSSLMARIKPNENKVQSILLSGGLDSLSVAVGCKISNIPFETYTLALDRNAEDLLMAKEFSKILNVKHNIIEISEKEIIDSFEDAILISECYHLYNVYCAVGMYILGKKLRQYGVSTALCGEALNEAVGDYDDWIVKAKKSKAPCLLQKINTQRLQDPRERILYVFGHSSDKGKFNRQLGSGLAKHAGSRMYKPFIFNKIILESPYYDINTLARIISIPYNELRKIGLKTGLIWNIFRKDFQKIGIKKELIKRSKKIRLQDSSEYGKYGISSVLLNKGFDQKKTINIFNSLFGANLDPSFESKRLSTLDQ